MIDNNYMYLSFSSFWTNISVSLQTVRIEISQLLQKLADQDLRCLPYNLQTYAVLYSLVDMKMTCFYLLKVASDSNFYLLFVENY